MTVGAEETHNRARGDIVLGNHIKTTVKGRQLHPAMLVIETNTQVNGWMIVNYEIRIHQAVIAPGTTDVNREDPFVFPGQDFFKTA